MKRERKHVRKLRSINFSIWLNFTLFAVVIVVVIALVAVIIVASSYSNRSRSSVRDLGIDVVEFIEDAMLEDSEDIDSTIRAYLSGVESAEYVKIYVIDENGSVTYGTSDYLTLSDETIWDMLGKAIYEYEAGGGDSYVVYSGDESTLNFTSRLEFDGVSYYLILNSSMRVVNGVVNAVSIYLIIMCVVAIIAAFIVSYFLSQHLSEPINSITQSASELAKGNYTVEFASAQYIEVAQLSDTLNYVTGEIKKSDDFQKQLIANVSHDLKTPLTMIKAYASMIKEISGDDPEKRNKHLDVIIDETDRLTGMINDMLKVSKVGSDSNLNKKVFNLTEFIYGILDKFDYLHETAGYTIMVDIDPDVYTCGDVEKLEQVVYNLVSNAVNYTGDDKMVYVSLKENYEAKTIHFYVRDTGRGIAPEDVGNIWDRYYRTQENHARPVKGTGLGLNIVKLILDQHKFNFGVDSKPGEGSTFWIDFPNESSVPDMIGRDIE